MHIIVDGYNLIRQSDVLRLHERQGLEAGRRALVHLLAGYRKTRGHRITVVFDGWLGGPPQEERDREGGIEIIYSRRGEKADEVIKRLARQRTDETMVVTADRPVMDAAIRAGATAILSREFEARIRQIRLTPAQGPVMPQKDDDDGAPAERGTKKKGPSRKSSKRDRHKQRSMEKL
ncbi:MAG TPA: NYN domain-containing protein [Syntrophales bacterium]|nr:NYN domain-containing protein [Syntrophales bacterium]